MKLNRESLKRNNFIKSLKRFVNSNFVAKIIVTIVIWAFALIPIWIYIGTRLMINPVGFWQEVALLCIFGIVIGWLQVIAVIMAIALSLAVIFDDL